jgi:serralysin
MPAVATISSSAAAATISSSAAFSGNRTDYDILYNTTTDTFSVTDRRAESPDGSDTIRGVELFQLADTVVVSSAWHL